MSIAKWPSHARAKLTLTPEALEALGATGKTITALAKELKVAQQTFSQFINKNLTNRQAFDKGRLKQNDSNT